MISKPQGVQNNSYCINENKSLDSQLDFKITDLLEYGNFNSTSDQIIITPDISGIDDRYANGFTICLSIQINSVQVTEKQKEDKCHLVQFGSRGNKSFSISYSERLQKICLAYWSDQEMEYLYSQRKMKFQEEYQIQVGFSRIISEEGDISTISLYINGVLEGQVMIAKNIQLLNTKNCLVYIGSENSKAIFKGQMKDLVIFPIEIGIELLKIIVEEKQLWIKQNQQRKITQILSEYEGRQEVNFAECMIQHRVPKGIVEKLQENLKRNDFVKIRNMDLVESALTESLMRHDHLNNAMRQMSFNYRWIFTALIAMSPSIEDGIGPKIPFFSLHSLIANGSIQIPDQDIPLYLIESSRFQKILNYINILITLEELEYLAQKAKCLRKFKYEQEFENSTKQLMNIVGIRYDIFMIRVRDVCLSKEEIEQVKQNCRINPHQAEENAEKERREIAAFQTDFMKDNKKPMFIYNSFKNLQQLLKKEQMLDYSDVINESSKYMLIGFYLTLPPLVQIDNVQSYNEFLERLFNFISSRNPSPLFSLMSPKSKSCQLDQFQSFCKDQLFFDKQESILEIFQMLCLKEQSSFSLIELSIFLQSWGLGCIYSNPNAESLKIIYVDCFDSSSHSPKYFFKQIVIEDESEKIIGLTGIENNGFLSLETLSVVTSKRKRKILPVKPCHHKQTHQPKQHILQAPPQSSNLEQSTNVSQESDIISPHSFFPKKRSTLPPFTAVIQNIQNVDPQHQAGYLIGDLQTSSNRSSMRNLTSLSPSLQIQNQPSSDRTIRFVNLETSEDNFTVCFDKQENRQVNGFEVLINQDHEYPIWNSDPNSIQFLKYICRFSALQLLTPTQKTPKSKQIQIIKSPPMSPVSNLKQPLQFIQGDQNVNDHHHIRHASVISNESLPPSNRPTQANSQYDGENQGVQSLGPSPPLSSQRVKIDQGDYPSLCNAWNQGKFSILIDHCAGCSSHTSSTWHSEADFVEKFNELGNALQSLFPNIEIIGNTSKPPFLEAFQVSIRGVGPIKLRDQQGRIFFYKKSEPLKQFLQYFQQRIVKVFDGLILICLSYGDSGQMEGIQSNFMKKHSSLLPPEWKEAHDFPCAVPERIAKSEKKWENEVSEGTSMICRHWGCGKNYIQSNDPSANKACLFHSKPFDLGSMHGLWPESWSCCRGDWNSKGCSIGKHEGKPEKKFTRLCINHGEINPETKHPDSACGALFLATEDKICRYHRGYFKREGTSKGDGGYWTCCTDGAYQAIGCHDDNHEAAIWPNEKAKIYFVEKTLINPGIDIDQQPLTFEKSSLQSTIYRVTEQYKPYVTRKTQLQQERKANENEIRICVNWGCEEKQMRFREIDNNRDRDRRVKNCMYHPGYFDFGNVNKPGEGILSIHQQLMNVESNIIHANAIRPHWTCCRKEWKAIGCKATYHWGPVEATMTEQKHGRWPDVSAMKYFRKQTSSNFKQRVGELVLNEDMARHYWYQFSLGKEQITISRIGELCDKFKLSWMALSEDLSYHFKYFDVVRGLANKTLDNGAGMIERETFTEWWFKPLDKYPINV